MREEPWKAPPTRHGTSLPLLGHGVRVRVRVPGRRARAGFNARVGDVDVAAVARQPFQVLRRVRVAVVALRVDVVEDAVEPEPRHEQDQS